MKWMKEIIKLLTPPIVFFLYRRFKNRNEQTPFSGVYNSIDEIHDENPWIQKQWVELSKKKLITRGISRNSFMPTSDFKGYPVLPCIICRFH